MYLVERILLGGTWLISFISIWFIPKGKAPEASFIFLFTQLPTWILGLVAVEARWLEYPVRELYYANATSFTYEFLALPLICVFFNLYYPQNKTLKWKLLYYSAFVLVSTLAEYIVEKLTKVIKYITWEWYWTLISLALILYLIRVVYKWFFKIEKPFSL
ncbi:MAG: hypothetical protein N2645_23195 [Clostridia bacterium]|nr:hypothetical protein [Clostridia bacterium]